MQNYETSGLKVPGKTCKKYHKKEQRFPVASHFNEFDTLMTNICIGSHKVCTTYWKHIYPAMTAFTRPI
jgi:hypothetical protein